MSIEQTLYCKVLGKGPAVVLIHGWGVNSAIWQPVLDTLSAHFTLYLVDLPGFGESAPSDEYSLQSLSEAIMAVTPASACWCGWSLGGLIATYTALHSPQKVSHLIQVSSSMKFVADGTWPGVEAAVFDDFLSGLKSNAQKTLTRFIALQAMGCASARHDSNTLKKLLADTQTADAHALISTLALLADSDLRASMATLSQPCLSLFGQFDPLVPMATHQATCAISAKVQVQVFENSSHAPFISETALFCQSIIDFVFA